MRPTVLRFVLSSVQQCRRAIGYHPNRGLLSILCVPLPLSGLIILGATVSMAQVLGEKAEMVRLEEKAEDAIAHGDPHGAALHIGKAALMASLLAEKETDPKTRRMYEGAEALFRAQENGYRALALFEQAGGRLPPPSGVCRLLGLAVEQNKTARETLGPSTNSVEVLSPNHRPRLKAKAQEWSEILGELQMEFSCS